MGYYVRLDCLLDHDIAALESVYVDHLPRKKCDIANEIVERQANALPKWVFWDEDHTSTDTLIIFHSDETGEIRTGCARCKPGDTFDRQFGRDLAMCRAMHWKDLEAELLAADKIESMCFRR